MIKEQKRLEKKIAEKQQQIEAQGAETERLKKMNKVLNQQMANLQSKSKLMAMLEDRDMDTPSSEDSSPKSSFSTKTTKIEIKKTNAWHVYHMNKKIHENKTIRIFLSSF